MPDRLTKFIATFFYLGFVPCAAGSLASIIGALLAGLSRGPMWIYLALLAAVTALGFVTGGRMERIMEEKDPPCVVIDEVAGAMIAFFMLPGTPAVLVTAFFVFRAFDMFKIYPADRLEQRPGGTGVMMDDVVAGIYTNLIMQAAIRLAGIT